MQYLFFSFWLTSLWQTLDPSTSLQISFTSFYGWVIFNYYIFNIYIYIYIHTHHIFIHSSVNGQVCFHVLAIINGGAMNTGVHVCFWFMVFSGYISFSGITKSCDNMFFLSFSRNFDTVLHSSWINLHSHQLQERSLFSTLSPAFLVCRFFDGGHSYLCKVITGSFDLQFSNNKWLGVTFLVFF